jgi:mannose-1-phosphate guanylyltransferase
MLIPVILSGGSGTRLWPLSRELYPKQLLPLVGKGTMLQETLARLAGVTDVGAPLVVCNESHRFRSSSTRSEPRAQWPVQCCGRTARARSLSDWR